jgi:hypothetical protein
MLALSVLGSLLFAGSALAASIGLNFTGSSRSQSLFIPPDTMGAVGGSDIVELINGRYAVYDKNTGLQTAASSLNNFWINAGVTPAGPFAFDPRIVYDAASSRYFAVAVDNPGVANNYLVAVSNGPTAASGWTGFQIDSDTDDSNWADFPMLGLDASSVYVTGNMFSLSGGPLRTSLLTLPKADLLLGAPSVANLTLFEDLSLAATGFTPQPVINYDGGGLPGSAGLLLSAFNTGIGSLKFSSITGTPVAPNLVTAGGLCRPPPPVRPRSPVRTRASTPATTASAATRSSSTVRSGPSRRSTSADARPCAGSGSTRTPTPCSRPASSATRAWSTTSRPSRSMPSATS